MRVAVRLVRVYWELGRRGYRRYAAYPAATWAGLFTNVMFGFMRGAVLLALYQERTEIGGYDARAAITYTWLTQSLLATIALWGWRDLAERIRSGDIAIDLARPVDPQIAGLASDLGRSAYHALYRGVVPLGVGFALYELKAPSTPSEVLSFLAAVVLAVAVSYAFRFLFSLSALWLLEMSRTSSGGWLDRASPRGRGRTNQRRGGRRARCGSQTACAIIRPMNPAPSPATIEEIVLATA